MISRLVKLTNCDTDSSTIGLCLRISDGKVMCTWPKSLQLSQVTVLLKGAKLNRTTDDGEHHFE